MNILAVDPGDVQSAYALYDIENKVILRHGKEPNETMRHIVETQSRNPANTLAVEMIASYGMPVGRNIFDTCVWIGRFVEIWAREASTPARFILRRDIKLHLCNSVRAKDPNITQAIVDRYGGDRRVAVGTLKNPGPLFGVSKDRWAAIAVALTAAETNCEYFVGVADAEEKT